LNTTLLARAGGAVWSFVESAVELRDLVFFFEVEDLAGSVVLPFEHF
jgi:hypothetical protein